MMNKKDLVKEQFDKHARQFSSWVGTKSEWALRQLYDFIGFSENDSLLDVACGSGNFAAFCAQRISSVHGVDISHKMIELAQNLVEELDIKNLEFLCHDVANLPFAEGRFSVVTSRSAFHHMEDYGKVFNEMVRCCGDKGLLCVNDITDYGDPYVSAFFDRFDRTIDISHCARVSSESIRTLFSSNGIEVLKEGDEEFEIDVTLYASHVLQSESTREKIDHIIEEGLRDLRVSKFLYKKDGTIMFRNRSFRILGRKQSDT
ncbi:MAG: class I SAM-dependent methyltransferase [Thermodesulfobacteriota bacterium]|nr:class I SAM-dependent methyltransferase [Thermodesulfobacteriota bacterium]